MARKKSVSEEIKSEPKIEESVVEEVKKEVKKEKPVVERVYDAPLLEKGIINASLVNVRAEAKADAAILTMLPLGTKVTIDPAESTKDFYAVSYVYDFAEGQGFIRKDLLNLKK